MPDTSQTRANQIQTPEMRDRGLFWASEPDWLDVRLQRPGWLAQPIHGLGQMRLSGNLEPALAEFAPAAQSVGLWQIASELPICLRIGRDKALLVTPQPLVAPPAWSEQGFAASKADDAYRVIEISGPEIEELASELTMASLNAKSPSAATLVAGIPALLYRSSEKAMRIHIERAYAAHLWHFLEATG